MNKIAALEAQVKSLKRLAKKQLKPGERTYEKDVLAFNINTVASHIEEVIKALKEETK
mgnify:CR=1 FL=1